MPLYECLNLRTGKVEEVFRTIAQRDSMPPHLVRQFTPPRHGGFIVGADADESPEKRVPVALRQLEEKQNWRQIEKDTGFTRDQLRETWPS